MTVVKTRFAVALLAVVTLMTPGALSAQSEMEVRGRVTGPDNAPIANHRVVLHRVAGEEGGVSMATVSTSETGEFVLRAPTPADTSAVYFAATLYDGELYLGPMFRPQQAGLVSHDIQVGVPGTSANAMFEAGGQGAAIPMGRPRTNRNWMLLAIPLLGVAAVAIYALVPRGRIAPERALLIRIAELDERMTRATPAQVQDMKEERSRLVLQLRDGA